MAQDKGQALDWDDEGRVEDSAFENLPAGTYTFEVVNFKRERYAGGEKMAACPVAALQLKCTNTSTGYVGTGFCRLFLNSKVQWRIAAFFKCVGLIDPAAPEGTRMPMSLFDQCVGCTGTVKVKLSTSTRNGRTYENNDFDFVVPKPGAQQPQAQPPMPQQQPWGGQGF